MGLSALKNRSVPANLNVAERPEIASCVRRRGYAKFQVQRCLGQTLAQRQTQTLFLFADRPLAVCAGMVSACATIPAVRLV